jgi:hypothetical protein
VSASCGCGCGIPTWPTGRRPTNRSVVASDDYLDATLRGAPSRARPAAAVPRGMSDDEPDEQALIPMGLVPRTARTIEEK